MGLFDKKSILGNEVTTNKFGDRNNEDSLTRLGKTAFVLDSNEKIVLQDNYLKCLFYISQKGVDRNKYTVYLLSQNIPTFEQSVKDSESTISKILNGKTIWIDLTKKTLSESIVCENETYKIISDHLARDTANLQITPQILDNAVSSFKEKIPDVQIIFLDDGSDIEDAVNSKVNILSNATQETL